MRRVSAAVLILIGLVVVIVLWRKPQSPVVHPHPVAASPSTNATVGRETPATSSSTPSTSDVSHESLPTSSTVPPPKPGPAGIVYAPKPPAPPLPELTGIAPLTVLENMRGAFRQYASRFGGNPVGTNPEITAALDGSNPKQVRFLDSEAGLRINADGELVDYWGVPFFFHQLSAKEMEIRSAGPDRRMWTSDDLVIK
jgi:hypothetical protein